MMVSPLQENHPDAELFRYIVLEKQTSDIPTMFELMCCKHPKNVCWNMNTWYPILLMALTSKTSVYNSIYICIYNHWCSNTWYIYINAIIISMLEIPSTMFFLFRFWRPWAVFRLFPATSMTGWWAGWIDKYSEVHVANPRMNHPNVGSYVHEIQFNWDKISINMGIFPRNGGCRFFLTWPPCLVNGMALRLAPFELRVICVVAPEQL